MSKVQVDILVMAAGGSKRMGDTIKQLLPWQDTTLISHAIHTAVKSDADSVKVVLGAYAEEISKSITEEVEVYTCKKWEQGLGTSIAFGVQSMLNSKYKPDKILIMLVDQPFVDTAFLNTLIRIAVGVKSSESRAGDSEGGGIAVGIKFSESPADDSERGGNVPEDDLEMQLENVIVATHYKDKAGVPAVFDKKLFGELCRLEGNTGAQNIIKKYIDNVILLDNPEAEKDIDSIEDYNTYSKKL